MRLVATAAGLVAVVVLAAGCGGHQASTGVVPDTDSSAGRQLAAGAVSESRVAGSGGGIWVVGQGSVSVEPDLALLDLGVEAQAGTVGEARAEAAAALTALVGALERLGVAASDIQTRAFNVLPAL